jgi:hypothetical protein
MRVCLMHSIQPRPRHPPSLVCVTIYGEVAVVEPKGRVGGPVGMCPSGRCDGALVREGWAEPICR